MLTSAPASPAPLPPVNSRLGLRVHFAIPVLVLVLLGLPVTQATFLAMRWRESLSSPWLFGVGGAAALYIFYWLLYAAITSRLHFVYGSIVVRNPTETDACSRYASLLAEIGFLLAAAVLIGVVNYHALKWLSHVFGRP